MSNPCKMSSIYGTPKPRSLAQKSSQATQSFVPLKQDNAIILVLEYIIQIFYLYILKRIKIVCTLLSVSVISNKSINKVFVSKDTGLRYTIRSFSQNQPHLNLLE